VLRIDFKEPPMTGAAVLRISCDRCGVHYDATPDPTRAATGAARCEFCGAPAHAVEACEERGTRRLSLLDARARRRGTRIRR
jgi:hypothetical protein